MSSVGFPICLTSVNPFTGCLRSLGFLSAPPSFRFKPSDHILMQFPLKPSYDRNDWNVLNKSVIAAALLVSLEPIECEMACWVDETPRRRALGLRDLVVVVDRWFHWRGRSSVRSLWNLLSRKMRPLLRDDKRSPLRIMTGPLNLVHGLKIKSKGWNILQH